MEAKKLLKKFFKDIEKYLKKKVSFFEKEIKKAKKKKDDKKVEKLEKCLKKTKDFQKWVKKNKDDITKMYGLLMIALDTGENMVCGVYRDVYNTDGVHEAFLRFRSACEMAISLSRIKKLRKWQRAITDGKGKKKILKVLALADLIIPASIATILILLIKTKSKVHLDLLEDYIKKTSDIKKILKKGKKFLKFFKKEKKYFKKNDIIFDFFKFLDYLSNFRDVLEVLHEHFEDILELTEKSKEKISKNLKKSWLEKKRKEVRKRKIKEEKEKEILEDIAKKRAKVVGTLLSHKRKLRKIIKDMNEKLKKIEEKLEKIHLKGYDEMIEDMSSFFTETLLMNSEMYRWVDRSWRYFRILKEGEGEEEEEKGIGGIERIPRTEKVEESFSIFPKIYSLSTALYEVFKEKEIKKALEHEELFEKIMRPFIREIDKMEEELKDVLDNLHKEVEVSREYRKYLEWKIDEVISEAVRSEIRRLFRKINDMISSNKAYRKLLKDKLKTLKKIIKGSRFMKEHRIVKDMEATEDKIKFLKKSERYLRKMKDVLVSLLKDLKKEYIKILKDFVKERSPILKRLKDFVENLYYMIEDMIEKEDIIKEIEVENPALRSVLEPMFAYEEGIRENIKELFKKSFSFSEECKKHVKKDTLADKIEKIHEKMRKTLEKFLKKCKGEYPESPKVLSDFMESVRKLGEVSRDLLKDLNSIFVKIINNGIMMEEFLKGEGKEVIKGTMKSLKKFVKIAKKRFKVKKGKRIMRKLRRWSRSISVFRIK